MMLTRGVMVDCLSMAGRNGVMRQFGSAFYRNWRNLVKSRRREGWGQARVFRPREAIGNVRNAEPIFARWLRRNLVYKLTVKAHVRAEALHNECAEARGTRRTKIRAADNAKPELC